jgi:broad specificity phosphatase PhoE
MQDKKYPKIILLRHAEGEHNITKNYNLINPLLTSEGIKQSRGIGRKLKEMNITQIYCSPLIRCIQTLDNLYLDKEINNIILDDTIIEFDLDNHLCNKRQDYNDLKKFLNYYNKYNFDIKNVKKDYIYGAKNIKERENELNNFFKMLNKKYTNNDTILIIGHYNIIIHIIASNFTKYNMIDSKYNKIDNKYTPKNADFIIMQKI